jgi:hypothetical protein
MLHSRRGLPLPDSVSQGVSQAVDEASSQASNAGSSAASTIQDTEDKIKKQMNDVVPALTIGTLKWCVGSEKSGWSCHEEVSNIKYKYLMIAFGLGWVFALVAAGITHFSLRPQSGPVWSWMLIISTLATSVCFAVPNFAFLKIFRFFREKGAKPQPHSGLWMLFLFIPILFWWVTIAKFWWATIAKTFCCRCGPRKITEVRREDQDPECATTNLSYANLGRSRSR